jgi:hypothetical protein
MQQEVEYDLDDDVKGAFTLGTHSHRLNEQSERIPSATSVSVVEVLPMFNVCT